MVQDRFLIQLAGAFLALACLTSPTLADGPGVSVEDPALAEVMAPAAGHDWQGFYAGLSLSQPNGSNAWGDDLGGGSANADWQGPQGVLALGYNLQRGNMVYGLELDYSAGNITATDRTDGGYLCGAFGGCATEVSKLMELRARIGWAFGHGLLYVSGGAARAESSASLFDGTLVTGSGSLNGYSIGLGFERAINERMSLRAEYSHVDLGTLELPNICNTCRTEVKFDSLRLGINFSF